MDVSHICRDRKVGSGRLRRSTFRLDLDWLRRGGGREEGLKSAEVWEIQILGGDMQYATWKSESLNFW